MSSRNAGESQQRMHEIKQRNQQQTLTQYGYEVELMDEIPEFLENMGFTGMPLPMSLRMNLHFGLSVAIGSKYGR